MKHRIGFNRLGKNVSHRQALYRSMATALFKYERIRTTKPKAKEIRRVAEKMITRARTDSVHNRRIIGKRIRDKAVLAKLFTDIAPRFKARPGGYTRILKLGQRYGDASEMVLLELVEREETAPRRRKKEAAKAEAEPAHDKAEPKEAPDTPPAKGGKASKPASATRSAKTTGASETKKASEKGKAPGGKPGKSKAAVAKQAVPSRTAKSTGQDAPESGKVEREAEDKSVEPQTAVDDAPEVESAKVATDRSEEK
jgi:large subunit ribosomal protein L17